MTEEKRREIRNCACVSNPKLMRPWSGGKAIRCPWSWPDEVWMAIGWWQDGLRVADVIDEPVYVGEALAICLRVAAEVGRQ